MDWFAHRPSATLRNTCSSDGLDRARPFVHTGYARQIDYITTQGHTLYYVFQVVLHQPWRSYRPAIAIAAHARCRLSHIVGT